jgi:hypothetical protein
LFLEEKQKDGYRVIGISSGSDYESWTKEELIAEILKLKSEIRILYEESAGINI